MTDSTNILSYRSMNESHFLCVCFSDIYSNYSTSVLSESIWMGIHDFTGGDGYRWQSIYSTIDASSLPLKNLNSKNI